MNFDMPKSIFNYSTIDFLNDNFKATSQSEKLYTLFKRKLKVNIMQIVFQLHKSYLFTRETKHFLWPQKIFSQD